MKETMEVNSKLLTAENSPLKLYLDGFDVLAFLETADLIHEHGGLVTRPDAETVVLSTPNFISGTEFLRFHVDWLHESIGRNELQDVGKYLIPSVENSFLDTPPYDILQKIESTRRSSLKTSPLLLEPEKPFNHPSSYIQDNNIHKTISAYFPCDPRIDQDRNLHPRGNKRKQVGSEEILNMAFMDTVPAEIAENRKRHPSTYPEGLTKRLEPINHMEMTLSTFNKTWSNADDEKLLKWLVNENLLSKTPNSTVWEQMAKANIFPPSRTAVDLEFYFKRRILPNFRKYSNDPEILRQFEELEMNKRKRR